MCAASAAEAAAIIEADSATGRAPRLSDVGLGRPSLGGRGTASSGMGCLAGILPRPLPPEAELIAPPAHYLKDRWRVPSSRQLLSAVQPLLHKQEVQEPRPSGHASMVRLRLHFYERRIVHRSAGVAVAEGGGA